ncbi:hypothetical protein BDZ97DRAFT_1653306 [Flammula alnicola]|nr:hypothetical protein BDZ97DRAFT_1653306 [Flammula alnicola]
MIPSNPPILLTSEDFPALAPSTSDPPPAQHATESTTIQEPFSILNSKIQAKAERKAAKKVAAAEKALERQKIAQEKAEAKAAEKAKVARERAAEKEKAPVDKPSPSKKSNTKASETSGTNKRQEQATTSVKSTTRTNASAKIPVSVATEAVAQVPLLSKKPKKNKPIVKTARVFAKEEDAHEENSLPSATDTSRPNGFTADSTPTNSRSHSLDRHHTPTSVHELLRQIDAISPGTDLTDNSFFDVQRLTSPAKMPLEYGPLVHALSALSVGGGSFANNMPSGSIDNAVSSFQQLLETLTQTISDLLRLLPRTTWDDSSSFDGVLRDMLKGDDFLDDGEDGPGKEDEVAALTLALERRARWMEVQLSKLEELHRDINTAAVRAVLSFNDSGWDRHGFLPRIGNTLRRFDNIGTVEQNGEMRSMTADELEKKLAVAKEAAIFAETEIREAMERFQNFKH